jgi:hypothetical protein
MPRRMLTVSWLDKRLEKSIWNSVKTYFRTDGGTGKVFVSRPPESHTGRMRLIARPTSRGPSFSFGGSTTEFDGMTTLAGILWPGRSESRGARRPLGLLWC